MPYVQHERGTRPREERKLHDQKHAATAPRERRCRARARRRRLWRQRQHVIQRLELLGRQEAAASQETGGKQGGILTLARLGRRRLPRPGPDVLHGRLPGRVCDAAGTLYCFKPDNATDAGPGPRRRRARDLERQQDDHGQDQAGRQVRPAGQPRGRRAKDVKYAFERVFSVERRRPVRARTSARSRARPRQPTKGVKPISGIDTPDDQTIVFKLKEPQAVGVAAALVMPITVPVPEEYATKFDAKNPSTYDKHVVATGPYMVKNDARATLSATSPASRSTSSATRTGTRRRTTVRRTSTRSQLTTQRVRRRRSRPQQVLTGSHLRARHEPAGRAAQATR